MKDDHTLRHTAARELSRGVYGLVKIRLIEDGGDAETVWAYPLGGDRYRLENIPILSCGASCGDVVEARVREIGDIPEFVRVVAKWGAITMWLIPDPPVDQAAQSQAVLDRLHALGCLYEIATLGAIVISVPPEVEVEGIREFLSSTGQEWGEIRLRLHGPARRRQG